MKTAIGALAALFAVAATAPAQAQTVFRQAHEVGFGQASSLDPASRGRVFQVTEKIMSRLIRPGLDGKPAPDLAESWTASADATEWTLKLRQGVTFHDGRPFTAEDAVWSLTRVMDPKTDSPARALLAVIKSVEAPDAATLKLTLTSPFADLPLVLTDYRLMMLPKDSGETIGKTGIGTGPFRVERFDAAGTTALAANPTYFEGRPGVARMEVIGIPDAQARFQALLGGQIDMLPGLGRQERALVERSPRHRLQEVPTGNWRGIVFRADQKPFDDARVRKALRLVADRKAMRDLVVGPDGGITGCDTPIGPTDQYRAAGDCAQDIAGAKKLLAEAGYPNGIDIELSVSTIEAVWPVIGEVYQQQAAAAGIRVKIVQEPADGYWDRVWMKKPAVMTRWNERPADAMLNEIWRSTSRWNESGFKDTAFDVILDSARREIDFAKRRDLYIQAQQYLWDNSATLVAFHVKLNVGLSARVKDLDAADNFAIRWHRVKVD